MLASAIQRHLRLLVAVSAALIQIIFIKFNCHMKFNLQRAAKLYRKTIRKSIDDKARRSKKREASISWEEAIARQTGQPDECLLQADSRADELYTEGQWGF